MSAPTTTSQSEAVLPAAGRIGAARERLDVILRRVSLPLLRVSLGLVFLWFGGLKVAGVTPVKDLVAGTLPWFDPDWFVPALGGVEILIGLGLVSGLLLGWVCAAMVAHLGGTFLTVVTQPDELFQHGNPLMLTMAGEFVMKNLVLISAALVIATWARVDRSGSRR